MNYKKIFISSFIFCAFYLNYCNTSEPVQSNNSRKREISEASLNESEINNDSNKRLKSYLSIQAQKDLNNKFVKAAKDNHLNDVISLFEQGAQINGKNDLGYTALMPAADRGNVEICKFLLENNANVNEVYKDTGVTALNYAIMYNKFETAKLLIKSKKINLNHFTKKSSYLTYACIHYLPFKFAEMLEIIELLLEYGANPRTPLNCHGKRFIDYANENKKIQKVYSGYKNNKHIIILALPKFFSNFPKELIQMISEYIILPIQRNN